MSVDHQQLHSHGGVVLPCVHPQTMCHCYLNHPPSHQKEGTEPAAAPATTTPLPNPSPKHRKRRLPGPSSSLRPLTSPVSFRSNDPYLVSTLTTRPAALLRPLVPTTTTNMRSRPRPDSLLHGPTTTTTTFSRSADNILKFLSPQFHHLSDSSWDLHPILRAAHTKRAPVMELDQDVFQELFEYWQDMPWQKRTCPQALEDQEAVRLADSIKREKYRQVEWTGMQETQARLASTLEKKRIVWWAAAERQAALVREDGHRQKGAMWRQQERAWESEGVLQGINSYLLKWEEDVAAKFLESEEDQAVRRWEAEKALLGVMDRSQRELFISHMVKAVEDETSTRTAMVWSLMGKHDDDLRKDIVAAMSVSTTEAKKDYYRVAATHAATIAASLE